MAHWLPCGPLAGVWPTGRHVAQFCVGGSVYDEQFALDFIGGKLAQAGVITQVCACARVSLGLSVCLC